MADDARTEARRRIAEAIEDAPWPCPHGRPVNGDSSDWFTCPDCRADAVLGLFPAVFWMPADGTPWKWQFLMLRGSAEPVVEEPTDA